MSDVADPDSLWAVLERLSVVVRSRRGADIASSYTAALLEDPQRAAKKFGEEAVEAVIAAAAGDRAALAAESADVIYHWIVLMEACGVEACAVADLLKAREGRSGLAEKASRGA